MKSDHIVDTSVRQLLATSGFRRIVVGISGGADSVALLTALSKQPGLNLTAVHCNFHLRGEESDRDMAFVADLCSRAGIRLIMVDFDVEADRALHGGSVEMACRRLRYDKFREILRETGAERVAVAHNADDQAETLLLNLMRGCGVAGLRGMVADTGEVIRPLLGVTRSEIEGYLEANDLGHVEDSTNADTDYRRNFIRNEMIPLLATRWPEVKKSLCRTALIMNEEERILDWCAEKLLGDDIHRLPFSRITDSPDAHWLVRRFVTAHDGNPRVADEIVRAIREVPFLSGKIWECKEGVISLERDCLEYIEHGEPSINIDATPYKISEQRDAELFRTDEKDGGERVVTMTQIKEAPLSELWTPLSPDEICFRHARKGDRISPLGMKGTMKVSKVMKDRALSRREKRLTVLAVKKSTGEIIWISGLKRSGHSLVCAGQTVTAWRYKII